MQREIIFPDSLHRTLAGVVVHNCGNLFGMLAWLNVIEHWFRDITQDRFRDGVFRSVQELEQAIRDYIDHHNANPTLFVWTQKAEDIFEKVARARKALDKIPFA